MWTRAHGAKPDVGLGAGHMDDIHVGDAHAQSVGCDLEAEGAEIVAPYLDRSEHAGSDSVRVEEMGMGWDE